MDSYFQDQQGNGRSEGSRCDRLRDAPTWLRNDGYSNAPRARYFQQETFPSPNHWSDYSQEDSYVACTPCPTEFSSSYEEQEKNSFEATVIKRLDTLQAQMDRMTLENEEIGLRCRNNLQTDILVMGTILRTRFEEEFRAYEERSIKRLEEHYEKIESMIMMLDSRFRSLKDKIESLHWSSQTVDCRLEKLEQRVGQLCYGVYKVQSNIVVSESDDDCVECLYFDKELPGYVGESIEEDARNDNSDKSAMKCEPTSLATCAYSENERLLCEDIISLRGSCLANAAAPEHSMNIEATREWDYMACSPVEERNHSRGAELPSHQEESSLSPTIRTCYSCELACAPQIQACFGALASSTSREKSHEEPSWEEEDSMVDFEEQKRICKKKRRVGTQVWIPKGTLEVMRVFHMTELKLGKTSCVPHKAKKRKRRRKSSSPQDGIG